MSVDPPEKNLIEVAQHLHRVKIVSALAHIQEVALKTILRQERKYKRIPKDLVNFASKESSRHHMGDVK